MLQQIRDRTSGIVAGFIVALLVVPFAFFGIETFNSGGGDPVVAKVGSQKIRQSQFQHAYDQRYQQFMALMGENFRADKFDQKLFRKMVLDDMTQEAMLRQYAEKAGYRANDAVLFDYISRIPAFQKEGKFDSETYKTALGRVGQTPEKFEDQVRTSIAIEQMRAGVLETAIVTDADAQQAWKLAMQERVAEYALFDSARYLAQATVSDEQLQARYEQKKDQLKSPERIRLAYVQLSPEGMAAADAPGQDVLKAIYDAEKAARYTTQEERKASHILVNFGADKSAAKAKAEGLAAQLKSGKAFADVARASSEDSGSKDKGGELGWNQRGAMPESFEKVLFDLKKGEVSEPVETEFGWHLIRLDDLKPSVVRRFEDPAVREELVSLYRNRELQKRYQEQAEKIEQLAFENPGSLDGVAKDLGLTVQTTDWFTRAGGAGIAANDAVKQAAFSAELLSDNENSKPISVGENSLVVVRKAEYEAPRQRPLAEVAETLREELRAEAAKAQAQADAAKLLAELRAGKPLAEAAAALGAGLRQPGALKRNDSTQDRALVEALFKLPRPAEGKPQFSQTTLGDGNVAVLALSAVQDPAPAAAEEIKMLRQRLREMQAGQEFAAYQKLIGQKVKVELQEQPAETPAPSPES
ncbi:MAG TPA: SurA N-terminal domain-containing protein [Solimonas sp.]|nr:SurA N-terminal domain-containing protein [Solimonas sp.]